MAKVVNPSAKPKKTTTSAAKKSKASTAKKNPKSQIKEVPKPEAKEEVAEEPKERVMNDEVIQEHILIRRNVNGTYIAQLSRIFTENAGTFIETFLSIFNEEEQKKLMEAVNIRKVEIATYESLVILGGPNSPLKESNKALYNIMRDITREVEGFEDERMPSEIIELNQYADQPVYIVIREGAYIFGIDSYINDIRKVNPRMIAMLAIDPAQVNEVIVNLLLLHIEAWIRNLHQFEFVTQEKVGEFVAKIYLLVTNIASGAMQATSSILTSNPNTDLYRIIQTTNNPDFTIQQIFSFRGVSILQVTDDALVVTEAPDIKEMLADDGTAEDDVTLMDVIDSEE